MYCVVAIPTRLQHRTTTVPYAVPYHIQWRWRWLYLGPFRILRSFVVGGLGFEFCVFIAGWRHALRSEWPLLLLLLFLYSVLLRQQVRVPIVVTHAHAAGEQVITTIFIITTSKGTTSRGQQGSSRWHATTGYGDD